MSNQPEDNKTPSINYVEFVRGLAKPGREVLSGLSFTDADAIHMVMGICGEAGELLDAIKKSTIHGKPYDIVNIEEELGDIEFYLQGLRNTFGLSRQRIIDQNVAKLMKRYPNGYTNKAAQGRADKA